MKSITGTGDFVDSGNGNFEHPDIALERDKSQGQIRQNAYDRAAESLPEASFSSDGRKLSEIVLDLMANDKSHVILWKETVCNDMDIHEAVNEACIALGLSDDDFSPYLEDLGHQIELTLI